LLRAADASGYWFLAFDDDTRMSAPRVCLLRHDVDADPEAALTLARIEAELGIRATYFFMIRSPLYNLFSRSSHAVVTEIVRLGHWLGLHFDVAFAPDADEPSASIRRQANIIAAEFSVPVPAVSLHQPALNQAAEDIVVDEMISAYNLEGFHYLSDANKGPEATAMLVLLESASERRVQILIHPIWWVADEANVSTEAAWDRALVNAFERAQEQLIETEHAYGARRAIGIEHGRGR
jgi:hypothetical protein